MAEDEKIKKFKNEVLELSEGGIREQITEMIERKMQKDSFLFISESIKKKKRILEEEKRKREIVMEDFFTLEDKFCEAVWQFSREHKFAEFIEKYPKIKNLTPCNCEFSRKREEDLEKVIQENEKVQILNHEIDVLKRELDTCSSKQKNLKKEIENVTKELELSSIEDIEIQRLTDLHENLQNELKNLLDKIKKEIQKKNSRLTKLYIPNNSFVTKRNSSLRDEEESRNELAKSITNPVKFDDSNSTSNQSREQMTKQKQNIRKFSFRVRKQSIKNEKFTN